MRVEDMRLERTEPLASMYTLSPFVWEENGAFSVLLRAVNHAQDPARKVARIYFGRSDDGLAFRMDDTPVIAPGPGEEDRDGCEDPTLARFEGISYVYYTGWNQQRKRGELLLACGASPHALRKRGVALASAPGIENPKEATIVQGDDRRWRLFFEYAAEGASKIGVAQSDAVGGPWTVCAPPFAARPESWDSWHLSTGPIVETRLGPLMFYNGATADAKWRIGWVLFERDYSGIVARAGDPLVVPPNPQGEDTDIAFAASALLRGTEVWLYYSVADKDMNRVTLVANEA